MVSWLVWALAAAPPNFEWPGETSALAARDGAQRDYVSAWAPEDAHLAIGARSGDVRVWAQKGWSAITTLKGAPVRGLAWVDSKTLLIGRESGLWRWRIDTKKAKRLGRQPVDALAVAGENIVTAHGWEVWLTPRRGGRRQLGRHQLDVLALAGDGLQHAFSASADGTIARWDLGTGKATHRFRGNGDGPVSLAMKGRELIAGGSDEALRVWGGDFDEPRLLPGIAHPVRALTVFGDPPSIATAGAALHGFHVWTGEWSSDTRWFDEPGEYIDSLEFSHDGRWLLAVAADGLATVWDARAWTQVVRFNEAPSSPAPTERATYMEYAFLAAQAPPTAFGRTMTKRLGAPRVGGVLFDAADGALYVQMHGRDGRALGTFLLDERVEDHRSVSQWRTWIHKASPTLRYTRHPKALRVSALRLRRGDRVIDARPVAYVPPLRGADDLSPVLDAMPRAKPNPNAHLLAIAVERYRALPPVDFAERSAQRVVQALSRGLGIPRSNIQLLTTDPNAGEAARPTKDRIAKAIQAFANGRQKDDRLYLYFVGHAVPNLRGEDVYLVGEGSKVNTALDERLSLTIIYRDLAASAAGHVVAIIDACFTGRLVDRNYEMGSIIPGSGATGVVVRYRVKSPPKPSRLLLLTGSGPEEVANPYVARSHRLFSYFFIRALAAGHRSASGLRTFLQGSVPVASIEINGQPHEGRAGFIQAPEVRGDPEAL